MDTKRDFRRPRVVVEIADDGTLYVEHYRNGQRSKEVLEPGWELNGIMSALGEAQAELAAQRRREADKAEAEALARHRRNYFYAANARHLGVDFANRVITKPRSELQRKRDAGLAPPAPTIVTEDIL